MKDDKLHEAFENWEALSGTREQRIAYEGRMKRIFDEEAAVREAELRVIESMKRGMEEGMEKGIREGRDLRDSEIVLNMYAEDISAESIVKLTKITLQKVKEIIESITK